MFQLTKSGKDNFNALYFGFTNTLLGRQARETFSRQDLINAIRDCSLEVVMRRNFSPADMLLLNYFTESSVWKMCRGDIFSRWYNFVKLDSQRSMCRGEIFSPADCVEGKFFSRWCDTGTTKLNYKFESIKYTCMYSGYWYMYVYDRIE